MKAKPLITNIFIHTGGMEIRNQGHYFCLSIRLVYNMPIYPRTVIFHKYSVTIYALISLMLIITRKEYRFFIHSAAHSLRKLGIC